MMYYSIIMMCLATHAIEASTGTAPRKGSLAHTAQSGDMKRFDKHFDSVLKKHALEKSADVQVLKNDIQAKRQELDTKVQNLKQNISSDTGIVSRIKNWWTERNINQLEQQKDDLAIAHEHASNTIMRNINEVYAKNATAFAKKFNKDFETFLVSKTKKMYGDYFKKGQAIKNFNEKLSIAEQMPLIEKFSVEEYPQAMNSLEYKNVLALYGEYEKNLKKIQSEDLPDPALELKDTFIQE